MRNLKIHSGPKSLGPFYLPYVFEQHVLLLCPKTIFQKIMFCSTNFKLPKGAFNNYVDKKGGEGSVESSRESRDKG